MFWELDLLTFGTDTHSVFHMRQKLGKVGGDFEGEVIVDTKREAELYQQPNLLPRVACVL